MIDRLYELIGGRTVIHAAVESFYKKVLADSTLSPFFDRTDMSHQLGLQSMFISMLLGGDVVYTGKDIRAAHAGARDLGLSDSHFDSFLQYFRTALQEHGVQADKLEKVMVLLNHKRDEILGR
jgi:hemoglobin